MGLSAQGIEIPFTYQDNLIWIKLHQTGNEQALNFLLDSGASVSVLDVSLAKKFALKHGAHVTVQGVEAIASGQWPVRFQFAETQFPTKFLMLDLSALSSKCVCKVDGLIGLDFFGGRIVEIDYEREVLRLLDKATTPHGIEIHLKKREHSVAIELSVNGKAGWFRVDTGCAHCLEWTKGTESSGPIHSRTSIGFQMTGVVEEKTKVTFANQVYTNVPTGMHGSRFFSGEDGLLGNPLLQHFKVTFDLPHSRLYLESIQR